MISLDQLKRKEDDISDHGQESCVKVRLAGKGGYGGWPVAELGDLVGLLELSRANGRETHFHLFLFPTFPLSQ